MEAKKMTTKESIYLNCSFEALDALRHSLSRDQKTYNNYEHSTNDAMIVYIKSLRIHIQRTQDAIAQELRKLHKEI